MCDFFDDSEQKLDPRLEEFRECFADAGMLGWLLSHQDEALQWLEVLARQRREREAAGNLDAPRKAVA